MELSTRDRVLQDAAREALHEEYRPCGKCGQRFVRVGELGRWYRHGEHGPPYGLAVNWCPCGRKLPS